MSVTSHSYVILTSQGGVVNRIGPIMVSGLILSLLLGCFGNTPLKTLNYPSQSDIKHKNLIIFLRGLGGNHRDFIREGFVDSVRQRNLPFDMTAPDAHFGYYFAQTITNRLNIDIIDPANVDGYEKIWLVGVSIGGLGSLMFAREHPEDVDGIYVISPFLGYEDIIDEITDAGGVQQWQPGEYDPNEDWQRMFWHWLKQCSEGQQPMPNLYLGFGSQDRFHPAHQLLSDLLPTDHIFTIDGEHDKKTIKNLWLLFLEHDVL